MSTPIESVAVPHTNFTTLPAVDSQFVVGTNVNLTVDNIQSKIRLKDLRQLQIVFKGDKEPMKIVKEINNGK